MKNRIGIVDYGLCNLLNVYNAFIHLGGDATIINNSKTIKDFTHIILPGVGAFKDGMKGLNDKSIDFCLANRAWHQYVQGPKNIILKKNN